MTKVTHIDLPVPRIGSKIWLLQEWGVYCLERCAGVLRTDACTHGGAGAVHIFDGIPEDSGMFDERRPVPAEDLDEFVRDICRLEPDTTAEDARARVARSAYNGRPIYTANPAVMGSWMMDGGFYHGLTLSALGGHESIVPFASIVWMPRPKVVKKAAP